MWGEGRGGTWEFPKELPPVQGRKHLGRRRQPRAALAQSGDARHHGGHLPTQRVLGPPAAMDCGYRGRTGAGRRAPICSAPKALTTLPRGCWGIRGTGRGGAVLWLAA